MDNNRDLQQSIRDALISEANYCESIIEKIEQVKIFAVIQTIGKDKKYSIDMADVFINFPFDWKKEIQILLADAVAQYFQTINSETI